MQPGTKLEHPKIVSAVGIGDMGEVRNQFRGLAVRPVEVPDEELPLDEEPPTDEELTLDKELTLEDDEDETEDPPVDPDGRAPTDLVDPLEGLRL